MIDDINIVFSSFTAICTVFFGFVSIWLYQSMQKNKMVATAQVGVWESIKALSGSELPSFLLKVATDVMDNQCNYRLSVPFLNPFVIGDPALQREILTDPTTEKSKAFYTELRQVFCGMAPLFTQLNYDGYVKSMRKSTSHAFSGKQVRRMKVIAKEELQKWLEKDVQELIDGKNDGVFDPCDEINRITFYVVCKAAFDYDCTLEEYNKFSTDLEPALREYMLRQFLNPLRKPFGKFIPKVKEALEGAKGAMAFAHKVLESYRKTDDKTTGLKSLVSIIESNERLPTDKHRSGEALLWMVAGHDTTGYSVATTMILLAKNKRVQDRLREELKKAKEEGDPSKSVRVNCPYLDFVWKESNRHVTVTPNAGSRTTGKIFYAKDNFGNEKLIPKGSTIITASVISNLNKNIFGEDSEVFRPERWEEAASSDPDGYQLMNESLLTFSAGNRSCPGKSLALAEIFTFLPGFFLNYKVEVVEEGHYDYFLTSKYKGAKLKVSKA